MHCVHGRLFLDGRHLEFHLLAPGYFCSLLNVPELCSEAHLSHWQTDWSLVVLLRRPMSTEAVLRSGIVIRLCGSKTLPNTFPVSCGPWGFPGWPVGMGTAPALREPQAQLVDPAGWCFPGLGRFLRQELISSWSDIYRRLSVALWGSGDHTAHLTCFLLTRITILHSLTPSVSKITIP